jgi:hypothetical protein
MSIQVKDGWWYKTRGGVTTQMRSIGYDSEFKWEGIDSGLTYRDDGSWLIIEGEESSNDLVEEIGPTREPSAVSPLNNIDRPVALSEALTCYVSFRDTPDVEALPDNTYAHILPNGALLVRTLGDDRQVALFAPNSWVNYVNKGAK